MATSGERTTRAVLGILFIAGGAVLLYLSSRAELRCTRSGPRVDCVVRARMLNTFTVHERWARDVRGASVDSGVTGVTNEGGARLLLDVGGRSTDLGVFSQRLISHSHEIDALAKDPAAPELHVKDRLRVRDFIAPAVAMVMGLFGLLALAGAAR